MLKIRVVFQVFPCEYAISPSDGFMGEGDERQCLHVLLRRGRKKLGFAPMHAKLDGAIGDAQEQKFWRNEGQHPQY